MKKSVDTLQVNVVTKSTEALAQALFISTFANPTMPVVKNEKHLEAQARQCIKAAKVFEKEWKHAN